MRCNLAGVFTLWVAVMVLCQSGAGAARTFSGRIIDDVHVRLPRPRTPGLSPARLQIPARDVDAEAYDLDLQQETTRHALRAFADQMRMGGMEYAMRAFQSATQNAFRESVSAPENAIQFNESATENVPRASESVTESPARASDSETEGPMRASENASATEDEQQPRATELRGETEIARVLAPAKGTIIILQPGVPKNDPACNCQGPVVVHIAECCIKAGKNSPDPLCGVPDQELSGNLADEWHAWEESAGKQLSGQEQKVSPGIYQVDASGRSLSGFSLPPFPSGSIAQLCHVTVACATEDKKF